MRSPVVERVRKHSNQTRGALQVLVVIAEYADDDGYAFPGDELIASDARQSKRQVERNVRACERGGDLFFKPGRGQGNFSRYVVTSGLGAQAISETLAKRLGYEPAAASELAGQIVAKHRAAKATSMTPFADDGEASAESEKATSTSPFTEAGKATFRVVKGDISGEKVTPVTPFDEGEKATYMSPLGGPKATFEAAKGDIQGKSPTPPIKEDFINKRERESDARAQAGHSHEPLSLPGEALAAPEGYPIVMQTLARICCINIESCTEQRLLALERYTQKVVLMLRPLAEAEICRELDLYLVWFKTRGMKDPNPTLSQVVDDWPRFEQWKSGNTQRARKNGRAPAPAGPAPQCGWREHYVAALKGYLPHVDEPTRLSVIERWISELPGMSLDEFQSKRYELDDIGVELG